MSQLYGIVSEMLVDGVLLALLLPIDCQRTHKGTALPLKAGQQ